MHGRYPAFLLTALALWSIAGCSLFIDGTLSDKPAEGEGGSAAGPGSTAQSTSATGGAGGDGPCDACEPEECCDGACTTLGTDPNNCGACGVVCPGTTCLGTCSGACQFEFGNCDGTIATGCEVNLFTDPLHCGACGVACPMGAVCADAECKCAVGSVDCDNNPGNGCEVDITTDAANCGGCGDACATNQECTGSACSCATGYQDCNTIADDGCERSLTTVLDCGACGEACAANQVCNPMGGGTCECGPGFGNCDTAQPDCEAWLNDATHCGACGSPCAGATPLCSQGECVAACPAGEVQCGSSCADLASDPVHCGACEQDVGPHQHCQGGVPVCDEEFGDCNGLPGDGCEVPVLYDDSNCGACDAACKDGSFCARGDCECLASTPQDCGQACKVCCDDADCSDGDACTVDTCAPDGASCQAATCLSLGLECCGNQVCQACCDDGDCNTVGGEICSGGTCIQDCAPLSPCGGQCVDLDSDEQNCMACGTICPGTTCEGAVCTSTCQLGKIDCDQLGTNGCEVDPDTDPLHCGGCGVECPLGASCVAGSCVCPVGTLDCDGDRETGCEVDPGVDPAHCGSCPNTCAPQQACSGGACGGCLAGFDDCNSSLVDGCETPLDTTQDCKACNAVCGAGMLCGPTGCVCDSAHLDCDMMPGTGCEVSKTDPTNCGACGVACTAPTAVCNGVSCVAGCISPLSLCGSSCVNLLTDGAHCGACDTPVGPNQACLGGVPTCQSGFGDCNLLAGDGCEEELSSNPLYCGSCQTPCTKAGAVCSGGVCACSAATPNDCGAACKVCCDDGDCSDGLGCTIDTCVSNGAACQSAACSTAGQLCCGMSSCEECCTDSDCGMMEVCSGSVCIPGCGALTPCGGQCVDLDSDEQNCGACGNDCLHGRMCQSGVCEPAWVPLAASPLVARQKAAVAWTGTRLFVWGGRGQTTDLSDGALYDPSTDAWTTIATQGAPSARVLAAAVWTGQRVFVFGGGSGSGPGTFSTGARYEPPPVDAWTPFAALNAPSARRSPIAVWTGTRVLIWGGVHGNGQIQDSGALYDPLADAWAPVAQGGDPGKRSGVAWAWTGSELLVFGGRPNGAGASNEGFAYKPSTDTWRDLPISGAPSARYDAFGAWTGSRFVVWGGRDGTDAALATGARYDPAADAWESVSMGNLSARAAPMAQTGWVGWTGLRVLFAGGMAAAPQTNGAQYEQAPNTWPASIPGWPSGKHHEWGAAAWSGSEILLWSGLHAGSLDGAGERYKP